MDMWVVYTLGWAGEEEKTSTQKSNQGAREEENGPKYAGPSF